MNRPEHQCQGCGELVPVAAPDSSPKDFNSQNTLLLRFVRNGRSISYNDSRLWYTKYRIDVQDQPGAMETSIYNWGKKKLDEIFFGQYEGRTRDLGV